MRWIVIALLLANIGLFAWFQTVGRPAVAPVDAALPPAQEEGQRLRLLRELPEGELAAAKKSPQKPRPQSPQPAQEEVCTIVGPFEEEYQGRDIAERMRALQLDASLREIEMEGQMRYWVFLPPLGSRREAFNKLRELQAAGVDSYVIPKGSLANGISLGIFSEQERAESLAAELRQRDIPAQTREEPQTYLERWIVLPLDAAEQLAGDFWQQLQREYPNLERRRNLCSELKKLGSERKLGSE